MTALDRFKTALEQHGNRPKKAGGGYVSTCPAHDDKQPSLSFKDGDKGVLVKCHAGCSIDAIAAALSLDVAELFDDPEPHPAGDFDDRIATTYDYVDENGEQLFQAVRLRYPKDFRQRRHIDGKWKWSLGDVRRVLYRLPAVAAATQTGRSVFIVEGEKDVHALEELGFVATCSPMGASKSKESSKWRDEYSTSLVGVPFAIIVPDCDEPGRNHAESAAASLHAAGVTARILDLAPTRDDGYDVSDFIAEHGDAATRMLRARATAAPNWTPDGQPDVPLPEIVTLREFNSKTDEEPMGTAYLGPLLRGGQRLHLAAPTGHGKTTLVLAMLGAAVKGEDFLGWTGRNGGTRAIYVDLEMPKHLMQKATRDAGLLDRDDISIARLPDGLAVDRNKQHRLMLERIVAGYDVVVIDPFGSLHEGESNEETARATMAVLDGLRERHSMAMIVVFHTRKPMGNFLTISDVFGSSVFQRGADIIVGFQRMKGNQSRLYWWKDRPGELEVELNSHWTLGWERGAGFRREEDRHPREVALEAIPTGGTTVEDLATAVGRSRPVVSRYLNELEKAGKVRSLGEVGGPKYWFRTERVNETRKAAA